MNTCPAIAGLRPLVPEIQPDLSGLEEGPSLSNGEAAPRHTWAHLKEGQIPDRSALRSQFSEFSFQRYFKICLYVVYVLYERNEGRETVGSLWGQSVYDGEGGPGVK